MENLDLTTLSPEQREKVLAIVNENAKAEAEQSRRSSMMDMIRSQETPESKRIREEYISGLKDIKKSEEYEGMDYDAKSEFNSAIGQPLFSAGVAERRRRGQLTHADKVTYNQLEAIHETGSPANFWSKVRNVVEAQKHVNLSDVSDELDSDTRKLLNEKNK